MAEGRALREGLQAVINGGYRNLEIEGDNMLVIQAIQDKVQIPWQVHNIVLEIKGLLAQCLQVTIRHIYREANLAADWLSKYGHSVPTNFLLSECHAPEFRNIIQEDWAGRTLVRRGT
uniref:RNase H type-1 domain-containing protein n=1 Tax=Opuntia streptacantha TaxID=393608 RepID=A0A7C9DFK5_OPUST